MCLIESKFDPAHVLAKKKPNSTFLNFIRINRQVVPTKHVFMWQHSLYRHKNFIPTSQVQIPEDINTAHQNQHDSLFNYSSHADSPSPSHAHVPFLYYAPHTCTVNLH